jgi:xanthine dehydrogenase accessory factor
VYDIALTVAACQRSGTRVDVAWVVGSDLATDHSHGALALTPCGGRVGSVCSGALDQQLVEQAQALGAERGRLVTLRLGDLEAQAFGLSGGGTVQAVVVPAALLPARAGAASRTGTRSGSG